MSGILYIKFFYKIVYWIFWKKIIIHKIFIFKNIIQIFNLFTKRLFESYLLFCNLIFIKVLW